MIQFKKSSIGFHKIKNKMHTEYGTKSLRRGKILIIEELFKNNKDRHN